MIAYATVGVNDMVAAIAFYDAVMAPLGAARETTSDTWTGYVRAGDRGRFFLGTDRVEARQIGPG